MPKNDGLDWKPLRAGAKADDGLNWAPVNWVDQKRLAEYGLANASTSQPNPSSDVSFGEGASGLGHVAVSGINVGVGDVLSAIGQGWKPNYAEQWSRFHNGKPAPASVQAEQERVDNTPNALQRAGDFLVNQGEDYAKRVSPDFARATRGSIFQNPSAINVTTKVTGGVAQSIPAMVAAVANPALGAVAFTEQGRGSGARTSRRRIMSMGHEALVQVPRYQELMQNGLSAGEARAELADEAEKRGRLVGGVTGLAMGVVSEIPGSGMLSRGIARRLKGVIGRRAAYSVGESAVGGMNFGLIDGAGQVAHNELGMVPTPAFEGVPEAVGAGALTGGLLRGGMSLLRGAPAQPLPSRGKMDDIPSGAGEGRRPNPDEDWENIFRGAGERGGREQVQPESVVINPREPPPPTRPAENNGEVTPPVVSPSPGPSDRGTPTYAVNWKAAREELTARAQQPTDALNGPNMMREMVALADKHGISVDDLESATPPPITESGQPTTNEARLAAPAPVAPEPTNTPAEPDDGLDWKPVEAEPAQPTGNRQAEQDAGEPAKAGQAHVADGLRVTEVPLANIESARGVAQVKGGADVKGVVEPLGGKFERVGVAPVQLWRRKNGKLYLISGSHRLDLANRSGEKTIPTQIHNEADGFTEDKAKSLDAELNIRDGQGKVADYVQYFQRPAFQGEEGRKAAQDRGLLARNIGKRAYALAGQGSPELLAAHRAGAIGDQAAVQIAQTAPGDERIQALGMKLVQQGRTIPQAVNTMRAVKSMGGDKVQSGDMFGFDDTAIRDAEAMAAEAAKREREINEQLSAVQGAAKRPDKAKKLGVDVKDPEDVKRKIDDLKAERERWQHWETNPELTSQIRDLAGLESASTKPGQTTDTHWLEQAKEAGVHTESELASFLQAKRHPAHEANFQNSVGGGLSDQVAANVARRMWTNGGEELLSSGTPKKPDNSLTPEPAPTPSTSGGDMFAPATSGENLRAAAESKDAERNGLDREGRKDIHAGGGELFEGSRPKQESISASDISDASARAAGFASGAEAQSYRRNLARIASDIASAVERRNAKSDAMSAKGKRSRAKTQTGSIAKRYGLKDGPGTILNDASGHAALASMGGNPAAAAQKYIESHLSVVAPTRVAGRFDTHDEAQKLFDGEVARLNPRAQAEANMREDAAAGRRAQASVDKRLTELDAKAEAGSAFKTKGDARAAMVRQGHKPKDFTVEKVDGGYQGALKAQGGGSDSVTLTEMPPKGWEAWWNGEMTNAGRRDAIRAVGATRDSGSPYPPAIRWKHLPMDKQADLRQWWRDHEKTQSPEEFMRDHVQVVSAAPAPKLSTETFPDGAKADDWWFKLSRGRRKNVIDAAGVDVSTGTLWRKINEEARLKLMENRGAGNVSASKGAASKPAPEPDVETSPARQSAALSTWVEDKLNRRQSFTSRQLFERADMAYDGTQAEGTYTSKDAYDAMEMGVNRYIMAHPEFSPGAPAGAAEKTVQALIDLTERLPTQTKRTGEMEEYQQFSTHPAFAYLANWAAGITPNDVVLEPSAGVGGIAAFAKLTGAKVETNELSERRAKLLGQLGFHPTTENAEQLHNILPDTVKPTVVVMNPPFSSTAGRVQGQRNTMNGARHIEQALQRLEPGGRLVAVVGNGMAADRPRFRKWWGTIKQEYNVRANIGLPGKAYTKYGTNFDNQLLVIDKDGPTTGEPVTGQVQALVDAVPLLENIHDDRVPANQRTESAPVEPERESGSGRAAQPGSRRRAASERSAVLGDGASGGRSEPVRGAVRSVRGAGPDHAEGSAVGHETPDGSEPAHAGRSGTDAAAGTEPEASGAVGGRVPEHDGGPDSGVTVGGRNPAAEPVDHDANPDSIYEGYTPQRLSIPGAKPHPGKLVQSAAMAAVLPPEATYAPNLPKDVVASGKLSLPQLEAVVYAGQAHQQILEDGSRRGLMVGDGTGVGKGREIAGIIMDNWRQGRHKAVWISEKPKLFDDAKRDFAGIGGDPSLIFMQGKVKTGEPIKHAEGIAFLPYTTLAQASVGKQSRLDQLAQWLGDDFDGVIAFDESHNMGNAVPMKGKRGNKEPAKQALAGVALQKRLPKARVVYVSATGATEVSNLAYATRLNLWGPGTAFPDVNNFIEQIHSGGLAAMELVSRDMKQAGAYMARSLSFDGVTYDRITHTLTDYQNDVYNELSKAWRVVLSHIDDALKETGIVSVSGRANGNAKAAALSSFWGTQQRFFNQVLTAMEMPSVLEAAQKDLDAGRSVVFQLVNTNEASLNRSLAKQVDEPLEELDMTPRDALIEYLRNGFPIRQHHEVADENGTIRVVPTMDSQGNHVNNKKAIADRDALIENLENIRVPDGPLEMLLDTFGADNVAEITGRSRRVVSERGKDGHMHRVVQRRSPKSVKADAAAFQAGKKRILVFSDAGGTGVSFHADLSAENQQQRVHYLVQAGWRADKAVQGFGRTHRTNEANQPIYKLVTTNLPAHKRFISSIARRLDQLGALTKGQRNASSGGLMKAEDNLEGPFARDAITNLFSDLYRGKVDGLSWIDTTQALGFDNLVNEAGGLNTSKIPDVPKFLNRLLSVSTDGQDAIFDAFMNRLEAKIQVAIQNGTMDTGMETVTSMSTKVLSEQPVYTDEKTGAQTHYIELELTQPVELAQFPEGDQYTYLHNTKSGRVWAVKDAGTRTDTTGRIHDRVYLTGLSSTRVQDKGTIEGENWKSVSKSEAAALWKDETDKAPKTRTEHMHIITGALLPIWDRLRGKVHVVRVMADDGNRYLGRQVEPQDLRDTLRALGASSSASRMPAADVQKAVMGGRKLELANGWILKKVRVNNEPRMEVDRAPVHVFGVMRELEGMGAFTERIQWNQRVFVPTGNAGMPVLEKMLKQHPVIGDVEDPARDDFSGPDGTMEANDEAATYGDTRPLPGTTQRTEVADAGPVGHLRAARPVQRLTAYSEQRRGLAPLLRSRAKLRQYAAVVEVGTFKSGIGQVRNWQDAAHVVAAIRKYPQEHVAALVADAGGHPLAVVMHTVGTANHAPANIATLAGSILQIRGANQVWFAHNHPSGSIEQSAADRNLTDRVVALMRGTGVRAHGMIVVGAGESRATYYYNGIDGEVGNGDTLFAMPIASAPRHGHVPRVERSLRKVLPAAEHGRRLSPRSLRDFVRTYGDQTGLLLFDNQKHSVGFLPMSEAEMGRLKSHDVNTGGSEVLRAMAESNASVVVPVVRDEWTGRNVGAFLTAARVPPNNIALLLPDGTMQGFVDAHMPMANDAYLSVGEGKGGIGDELEATVASATKGWDNKPTIIIKETADELPDRAKTAPGWEQAEAYYDGDKVYLVRANLSGIKRVYLSLAHDAIGHYGTDRIIDDYAPGGWDQVTRDIARMRRAPEKQPEAMQVVLAETERRYSGASDSRFAHEALGVMAEHGVQGSLMTRVIAALRRFLRKLFPKLKFTYSDLMGMLGRANKYVRRQGVYHSVDASAEPSFSRTDTTRTRYEQRMDELFDGAEPNPQGVRILDNSDVLSLIGYGDMPVVLNERHAILEGGDNHPLPKWAWRRMPEWIDNPAAVFERRSDGHLTMIGPEKVNGHAVIIGIAPEVFPAGRVPRGDRAKRRLVLTAHEKDSGTLPVASRVETGDLVPLYIDTRKTSQFYMDSGVQFPGSAAELRRFNHKVNIGRNLVKYRAEHSVDADEGVEDTGPLFSRKPDDMTDEQAAAMGKMGGHPEPTPLKVAVHNLLDRADERLVQQAFDQFSPLKNLDMTAYMQARLSRGTDGALEAMFLHGTPKLTDGALDIEPDGSGFRGILSDLNGEGERFLAWIAGNRSYNLSREWVVKRDGKVVGRYKDKAAANTAALKMLDEARRQASMVAGGRMPKFTAEAAPREFLFNDDEIDALRNLNKGTMPDGRNRTATYAKSLSAFRKYQKAVLDIAQEAGLIDPESRKTWESEFYVPFYRAMEADSSLGYGQASSGLSRQRAIRELKGSKRQLQDLLYNTMANWSMMLTASMRNLAAQGAMKAAVQSHVAERLPAAESGSVWIMERGKQIHYMVHDPLVMIALSSLNYNGLKGPFWDVMRWFKRALTTGVTASPDYRIRNLARDTISTLGVSGDAGWNPVANIVNGLSNTSHGSDTDIKLLAGGGKVRFGTMLDSQQAHHAKELINLGIKGAHVLNTTQKTLAALRAGWDWWKEVGDRAESVNRAVLYRNNYARTGNHLMASYEARDLLDFTMSGSSPLLRVFTSVVPFMNTRLQGAYKIGRAAKHHPKRLAAVVGLVALASALNYLNNKDDPEYQALPDWVRNSYWVVDIGPYFVYIPKPFEIGAMGTVVERGTELATAGDDYQAKDFARSLSNILAGQLAMNPIPQAIRPGAEAYYNRDMFRERNIDTRSELNRSPETRYTPTTSAGAIALGRAVNVSPKRIAFMMRGYFGWLGSQALNVSDLMLRGPMGLPSSPRHDYSEVRNLPVVSAFIREKDSSRSKYMDRFYRSQAKVDQIYQNAKFSARTGDVEKAKELFASPYIQLHSLYHKDSRAFGKIRHQIKAIGNNQDLSVSEKYDRINKLYNLMDEIAKQADEVKRRVVH